MDKRPGHEVSLESSRSVTNLLNRSFRIRWAAIAVISAVLTLSGWAISSPVGSSPDDSFHLPSIWCGQGFRDEICEESPDGLAAEVPMSTFRNSDCFAFDSNKSGRCTSDETLSPQPRVNFLDNLYPPTYYWSMSWFVTSDVAVSTIVMRVISSVFFLASLLFLVVSLPSHLRRVPVVTFLITSVPLGVFLIASTNPSGWAYFLLILFYSAFTGFLVSGDPKSRWILGSLALIFSTLASGTRADASVFVVLAIILAFIVSFPRAIFSAINICFTLLVVLIALYYYTSIETGTAVVISEGLGDPSSEPASAPGFFVTLAGLPNLWVGVFGASGLGWLDTPMPAIVWALTLGVFMALMFSAVQWFTVNQSLGVTSALFFLTFIPLYILLQSGLEVGQQVQPRYLLPLIGLLAATALHRTSSDSGMNLSQAQVYIVGFGIFVANAIALHLNLRRYVTGMDIMGVNLDEGIEWWWDGMPLSPNSVWLIATLASMSLLFSVWKLRHELGLPVRSKLMGHDKVVTKEAGR